MIAIIAVAAMISPGAIQALGGAFTGGAVVGFVVGGLSTGTFEGAIKGAIFGAISGGIAEEIGAAASLGSTGKSLAHGFTQGGINVFRGGDFKSGFLGGYLGHSIGDKFNYGDRTFGAVAARTTAMAVVGGASAKLGGGKFANGAVSAAFVHLFNREAHRDIPLTADEAKMAEAGDWMGFYESRVVRGDPYTSRALEIGEGESLGARYATSRLEGGLAVFGKEGVTVDTIRVDLAQAYAGYLRTDSVGRIGVLHVEEIAQFHFDVFQAAGMPRYVAGTVYGGTLATGLRSEANVWGWYVCGDCDTASRY